MLMVVSADGDPSNVDNFTAGETIPEWRLVPNDNNIAQRNVNLLPAGGGKMGLIAGLHGKSFFVGNPDPKRGNITFNVVLPELLTKLGWRLELVGADKGFTLASGAQREVFMQLHAGGDFTAADVEATQQREFKIEVLSNDNVIGGMTYVLDSTLSTPYNDGKPKDATCVDQAQRLADCLGIKQDIDQVCVKEITLSLKVKGCGCC
ncbi:MAG TPA: hypothetical protein VGC21_00940 [Telluria sp.]|jgi:hypothetical protein